MTMTNNNSSINKRAIDDEAYEEAGVEIVAVDAESIEPAAEAEETEECNDNTADSPLNKRLIMLWGLAIGAVAVVSYTASSSSASASGKMMNINQIQQQPKAIKKGGFKFDYVGVGQCLDDNPNDYNNDLVPHGNIYEYLGYFNVDAKECAELCAECPGEGQGGLVLRGFHLDVFTSDPLTSECHCLVDYNSIGSHDSFANIATGVCNAQTYTTDYGDNHVRFGNGEIMSATPDPRVKCWKISSKSSKAKSSKSSSTPSSKGSKSSSTPQRY